jgi:outer membrane protein OmpA-like peptidoglycan-associated protein
MIAAMGDHDRDAILARRALFISAALAGIACTAHEPPSTPQPDATSVEPREPASDDPSEAETGEQQPAGAWPSWSEIMAQAPPLDVPEGLTEREHELLTSLADGQRRHYDALAKLWEAPPACGPSEADCKAWAEAIEAIQDATHTRAALCGYAPEVTNTYIERQHAHARYLQVVADMLLSALDASVEARTNSADSLAWASQRQRLELGRPHPCLSCMRPVASPITERVSFEPGQAALAQADSALASVHATHQHNGGSRLIVRGHADESEPDPELLARKRAEAVAARLIELGVPRRELEIRSYGSSLPITHAPSEAALNRRVDFEVVPPER